MNCAEMFIEMLKKKGFCFNSINLPEGEVLIDLPFGGKSIKIVFNGDEKQYVAFMTLIEQVTAKNKSKAIIACNAVNSTFRWVKSYIANDDDLVIGHDAILSPNGNCDEVCFELLRRYINLIEGEVKPILMSAIYG